MRARRLALPALIVALGVATPASAAPVKVEEVARGLDSPRHLAFGADGDLFVAEAGRGGADFCFIGGEGPACMGATGAVTKVDKRGRQSRIATGLASYANTPNNDNAIGPHGIEVLAGDAVLVTNGGPTEPRDAATGATIARETLAARFPYADLFGRILLVHPHVKPIRVYDTYDFERRVNPDTNGGSGRVDANPVDVEIDGLRMIWADAGGNSLNAVNALGRASNLAVFENRPDVPNPFGGPAIDMQAVPTSVEVGPDGNYYVSQLTGFPFPVRGANIYKVSPRGGKPQIAAGGFTMIMDLAFAKDGTLYVLEIDSNNLLTPGDEGAIYAIDRKGNRRKLALPAGSLPFPGGIAIGKDGLYASINSGSPGGGKVVRIRAS
jgi:hypothetical protein